MTTPLDLDELIASGEIEADPVTVKHARLRLLEREALAAFRIDPEYAIALAKAAHEAARIQRERLERDRTAPKPTPESTSAPAPKVISESTPTPAKVAAQPISKRVRLTDEERRERRRAIQRRAYARLRDEARESTDPDVLRRAEERAENGRERVRQYRARLKAAAAQASTEATA